MTQDDLAIVLYVCLGLMIASGLAVIWLEEE